MHHASGREQSGGSVRGLVRASGCSATLRRERCAGGRLQAGAGSREQGEQARASTGKALKTRAEVINFWRGKRIPAHAGPAKENSG
jgi:hypothetical protein